ncbi:Dihydrodipicolinate synthetase-like protein [Macrophomina phaseolina MS6]|uniref:Dihydrodipicolinate synthetase-like protein n=1 Tax=Macrophomina phaseolina (strain MS6) TaxID=1126212 RepID=K2RUM2_MACPH|nr:Dihydrodipicolinate synthetase-like protein [Macrophomina phaseolina MS6]
MYYNIPAASGVSLSPEELAGLREVGVRCMKDASGNAPALAELLFGLHDRITAFNGWDTRTSYGLCAGAKGSVWGAANVVPELCARLWEAVAVRGDLREGRELWAKIWPVCKFLESHNYAAAVKAGVALVGGKTGGLRKPFAPLEEVHRKEFAGLLKAAGVKVVE